MKQVGIIMGSDSDLPIMSESAKILDNFGINYDLQIVSAHRTPDKLYSYSKEAKKNGLKVIIAGAGGAAHLPGMVASLTTLPVIGVPIKTATLQGLDSLYSIVQMPKGIPVATVAINGSANAALLAIKMLASFDDELSNKLEKYKLELENTVLKKSNTLEKLGYSLYIDGYL